MKKILCLISMCVIISCQAFASDAKPILSENTSAKIVEVSALSRIETKIREAAVVVTTSRYNVIGSGTYVSIGRKRAVITAAHVIGDGTDLVVIGRVGEKLAATVIYQDDARDIAVLSVPQIRTRSPVRFKPMTRRPRDLIGLNVTYTGFPNGLDLMTISGRVSGYDAGSGYILLHSLTWPGASGSCVFDQGGNLIGVLSMVSVGEFIVEQIIEDIVWVTPISEADISEITLAIETHG